MKLAARKCAAEQGITEEKALKRGMEAKSKGSRHWVASEKNFAQRKAESQACRGSRSQFAVKGEKVYMKA